MQISSTLSLVMESLYKVVIPGICTRDKYKSETFFLLSIQYLEVQRRFAQFSIPAHYSSAPVAQTQHDFGYGVLAVV